MVLSTQHAPEIAHKDADREAVIEEIIKPVLPKELVKGENIKYLVNPDRPLRDRRPAGRLRPDRAQDHRRHLRRRRPHGGGAFSGKDPSKVDRSAAYAARYVAKNIVAAGLADTLPGAGVLRHRRGQARPASWSTPSAPARSPTKRLDRTGRQHFDLRPKGIVQMLDLLRPIYEKTAAYGHFGRDEPEFHLGGCDKAAALKAAAGI